MYLTKELALRMESCIKQTHIEMAQLHPLGKVEEVGGGAACFSGASSFFSQVIAWGFNLKPKQFKTQIQMIEGFYRALGHTRVDIELCPLVGNDLPMALSQRGYQVTELNNVSFIELHEHRESQAPSPFEIRKVPANELATWAKKVALGFGHVEAQDQFTQYAKLQGVTAFGVYHQEQIIAGATVAMHGEVADLGVTSTLSPYRGRGIQKLLLSERLNYVKKLGIPLATVTTAPGSISDLNVQKTGFRCAYTRLKMQYDGAKAE
jgi:GNAT superfamily N-acetyltransferase